MASPTPTFDKQDQLDRITEGLLDGETVTGVFDCIGAGTGFVGLTDRRVILQDNSFVGKKVALTSVPYSRVQAVSFVTNRSVLGKFVSTGEVSILVAARSMNASFAATRGRSPYTTRSCFTCSGLRPPEPTEPLDNRAATRASTQCRSSVFTAARLGSTRRWWSTPSSSG